MSRTLTTAGPAARDDDGGRRPQWWRGAVGYEIYVRSFQDSDGDGTGDLPGIRQRLPYLRDLHVDALWLTPCYPSPQADHGYDVADYHDIEPAYGTLDDARTLIDEAHDHGLRLIMDLVPNHTSDQHRWFRAALADPTAPERDYYIWRDPGPDGGPPNNWLSHFGGPAWTLDEASGQYYLHLFLPEQPDLNWANPAVADEFDEILEFWFEAGADGFRIDVAHALAKDPDLRDNPLLGDAPDADAHPQAAFEAYDHRYDLDQDAVLDVYRRWRSVADRYDAVLLGEVYLLDADRLARYVRDDDGLHSAFAFAALKVGWDAAAIRAELAGALASADGGGLSWPLSSHDDPRAAERFGGGPVGARRALAYLTLLCGLPGNPFLFQGDELGLDNGDVDAASATDPVTVRNQGAAGRDGSRTPMPWEPGDGFGFTTGTPWLPVGSNRSAATTVAGQLGVEHSNLERTRELLRVRRGLDDLTGDLPAEWVGGGTVVAVRRGDSLVVCNVGSDPTELALDGGSTLLYATDPDATSLRAAGTLRLPADAAAIVGLAAG